MPTLTELLCIAEIQAFEHLNILRQSGCKSYTKQENNTSLFIGPVLQFRQSYCVQNILMLHL